MEQIVEARAKAVDGYTVADLFDETVASHGDHTCFICAPDTAETPWHRWTFKEADAMANRIANWAAASGVKPRETVALFLENRAEFVLLWLGLAKVGAISAWINNTIKGGPLVHSVRAAACTQLIFGVELADVVQELCSDFAALGVACFCTGGVVPFCACIDSEVDAQSDAPPARAPRAGIAYKDTMCYIYTSGTTGLPKAAMVTHAQWCNNGLGGRAFVTDKDVIYGSGMPLYHSAAGLVGMSATLTIGNAYVIRRRFSATAWLDDIRYSGATVAQYIGELCRYVLGTTEGPEDTNNRLRLCIGNGLRPEYWDRFQLRFGIDTILEFFGATEGPASFMNVIQLENLRKGDRTGYGSVGQHTDPNVIFARYDVETDALVRGEGGFCQRCGPNEAGEMLVRLDASHEFLGYTDREATEKKMLRDVFEPLDLFMRMGDLMRVDQDGWVYFVDRIGDTFRWKGENVSTTEVASELSKFPGASEVNVYGVLVPNNEDGRAGMSALVMEDLSEGNLAAFHRHAAASLPSYAVPLFLRILPAMSITGTFKHQKVQLRNEGIDIAKVCDPIYYLESGRYLPLTKAAYVRITSSAPRARL